MNGLKKISCHKIIETLKRKEEEMKQSKRNDWCLLNFLILLQIILLFPSLTFISDSSAGQVLVFPPDSRRDPICHSESMARRALAVADINGGCTAYLISPENHVLTAAHCFGEDSNFWSGGTATFRFGFQFLQCEGDVGDPLFWGPIVSLTENDVVKDTNGDPVMSRDLDYLLLQIPYVTRQWDDIAVSGPAVRWLELDPDTRLTQLEESNKGLYILANNPEFGTLKISQDDECRVIEEKTVCEGIEETGGYNPLENACFNTRCDSMQGNSGGAVLLNINNRVIGFPEALDLGDETLEVVKIRRIYPEIRKFLPTSEELGDNDGDGMPNVRDNCPDVPNTGTCTAGKVGVINCLGYLDCDTSFGAFDGVCDGSQLDSDSDGVGDACATLPQDAFEPNDLPVEAAALASGVYFGLTLHDRDDTDFYNVTMPHATDSFLFASRFASRDRALAVWITYRDCPTCPSALGMGQVTYSNVGMNAWEYREEGIIPEGRIYQFELYEAEQTGPMEYDLVVSIGGEELPPDFHEPNDTATEATSLSGCDFTGLTNIQNISDVDYYKIEASGYSVKAEISFDTSRGELELFLDDIQATELPDGTRKTLSITGCGQSRSYMKVQGQPNFYDICIRKVPVQEGCPGYSPYTPFVGSGTFQYSWADRFGLIYEGEAPVNEQMFLQLFEESPTSVKWRVFGSVDYGIGFNQAIRGELEIPRPYSDGPVPFSPLMTDNQLIVEVGSYPGWFQMPPDGQGEGTFEGPDNAIVTFSIRSEGLQCDPCFPVNPGVLTMEGRLDTDRDSIPDEIEIATGTDPNSDDTDGDGLRDGTEDANQNGQRDFLENETDPRVWDTDGDGVSDGVESGITSPEGNDTDPGTFQGDQDPATTTDPTGTDTDGDGMSDGEEDANQNGRVDPGETSPLVSDVTISEPDLIIESLTHSPANPTTLDTITFTAVVKNIGNAQAGSSTLNFRIGGETFGQNFAIPELDLDESFTVERQEVLGIAQNYRNTVTADINNDVDESNEDNNQKTDDYTVRLGGDLDDDGDVDMDDLDKVLSYRNQPASECPECDLDGDGMITALDARKLILLCTRPRCATQ